VIPQTDAAATLRSMLLTDADGPNRLVIRVTGYQFPDALDLAKRFSWHMVGGEAHCQEGSWRFHWQALTCDESPRVSAWLTEVARSVTQRRVLPGPLQFLEPNLTFRAFPQDAERVRILVSFDLEFEPPGTSDGALKTPSRWRSPWTKGSCGRRLSSGIANVPLSLTAPPRPPSQTPGHGGKPRR
jgi:hypothetical protein